MKRFARPTAIDLQTRPALEENSDCFPIPAARMCNLHFVFHASLKRATCYPISSEPLVSEYWVGYRAKPPIHLGGTDWPPIVKVGVF